MRPTFDHHPPRLMTKLHMHMWGDMMPKSGQTEYSARISIDALGMLTSEDGHMFFMVLCPYVGMDWR